MILVTLATASNENLKRRANKQRMLLYEACRCREEAAEDKTSSPFFSHCGLMFHRRGDSGGAMEETEIPTTPPRTPPLPWRPVV